jgi:Membrane-associated phospholipid phosphatase
MRRQRIWFIVVPMILFAMLAVCIRAGITVRFEGWAYRETVEDMSPALTAVMRGITHLGDAATVITFCLLLFVVPRSRRTIALPVSVAVILATVFNIMLKEIFARERPDILRLINETGYSFPSGHAMINAALYTMLVFLIFRDIDNLPKKIVLSALCIALTILIGCSRIYLGVHYAGDVLGGWLFGFAVSALVFRVWNNRGIRKTDRA